MDTCGIERSGGLRNRWETHLHADRSTALPSSRRQHVPAAPSTARLPAPRKGEGSLVAGAPDAPQLALVRTRLLETDCGSEFLRPNSEGARDTRSLNEQLPGRRTTFQSNFVALTTTQRNIVTRSTVSQLSAFYRISLHGQK